MPFVTSDHRMFPDPTVPGDRCYVFYKHLIEEWTKEPRWTTADRLYKEMLTESYYKNIDQVVAYRLAWQVFFIKKVMPYENDKCRLNGDI